jgi:hypothetical protein
LSPLASNKNEVINPNSPVKVKTAEKVKTADRIGQQTWGPPRTIELHRQPDKSLIHNNNQLIFEITGSRRTKIIY